MIHKIPGTVLNFLITVVVTVSLLIPAEFTGAGVITWMLITVPVITVVNCLDAEPVELPEMVLDGVNVYTPDSDTVTLSVRASPNWISTGPDVFWTV